jgi:type I restriction enzyme R subunit
LECVPNATFLAFTGTQVMEELIQMATKIKASVNRGVDLGLNRDELAFYDALANNEESVAEQGDETLKKIAHELAEGLRKSASVDWSVRESIRTSLRLMMR